MAKMIKITLDESDASFSVDLTGFHGKGCSDVIKAFADVSQQTKEIHKPEFKETNLTLQLSGR